MFETTTAIKALPLPSHNEGDLVGERYRIDGVLGQGGYGVAYLAYDLFLKRRVCVKLSARPSLYYREAPMLGMLLHPNIPKLFDRFADLPYWGLVMEYIEGWTLRSYLDTLQGCPLPIPVALHISLKLCDILGFLHRRRYPIVFCDLKPANVVMTKDSAIYLVDFGIARLDPPCQSVDPKAGVLGTPCYMSPEYCTDGYISAGLDLFALGAIMHEMLTGERPRRCVSQHHGPRCLCNIFTYRSLHGPLGTFVMRLLEHDYAKRPVDVTQVKEELEALLHAQKRRKGGLLRRSDGRFHDTPSLVW